MRSVCCLIFYAAASLGLVACDTQDPSSWPALACGGQPLICAEHSGDLSYAQVQEALVGNTMVFVRMNVVGKGYTLQEYRKAYLIVDVYSSDGLIRSQYTDGMGNTDILAYEISKEIVSHGVV